LDWRTREQQNRIARARAQLEELMGPLQIQEIQEQLRQLREPKPAGTVQLPGGGLAGVTFSPEGKYATQTLIPGMDKESARRQLQNWRATVPTQHQSYYDALEKSLDEVNTDPMTIVDEGRKYAEKITETVGRGTPKVLGTIPYGVSDPQSGVDYYADAQGRLHSPDGGPAPQGMQELYTSAYQGYKQREQDAYDRQQRAFGAAFARQARQQRFQMEMQARKAGNDAADAQARMTDAINASKKHTNANDIVILEQFMQLSFGRQPRGIRGSPAWFDEMRQLGGESVAQRVQGWWHSLSGGGLLGDDARAEMVEAVKMLAKTRVQAALAMANSWSPGVGVPAMPGVDFPEETARPPGTPPPPPVPGAVVTPTRP
jgi:hypothetical protein